ncbi:hypothetical protein KQS06HV_80005 [Klebsiella quasipneumoniae subsp. similipneumoniae]|nr:hypothetical protein KQS06HV_80005 [Klebsiella quasipneumoniae subsp. similipneumoniae]
MGRRAQKSAAGERKLSFFHLRIFSYKTIIFAETVRLLSNRDIKKSCVLCDVCGTSLGIPSNKKPESTENDSPSTSD